MRVALLTGRRAPGDTRITLLRVEFRRAKFSISLHPRLWYWRRGCGEVRVTLFGINLHAVRSYGGTFH
jgi:hypothetical protein